MAQDNKWLIIGVASALVVFALLTILVKRRAKAGEEPLMPSESKPDASPEEKVGIYDLKDIFPGLKS